MGRNGPSNRGEQIPKSMLIMMVLIVGAIAGLSIYANWQNAHRDRIESTIVTRFTPTPTPRPSQVP
jgi:hypothetical protein